MGSNQSSNSTQQRINSQHINKMVNNRIDKIKNFELPRIDEVGFGYGPRTRHVRAERVERVETALTNASFTTATQSNISQYKDIAINQMNRVDKPLIKDDLIATICALNPTSHPDPHALKRLTVKELTLMLRLIIYDPERYNEMQIPSAPPLALALEPSLDIQPKLFLQFEEDNDMIFIDDAYAV
jgi:hypothetical protein